MRVSNDARYRAGHDRRQVFLTPAYILEPVREAMGGIELDPCTEPDNPTGADRFFALPVDGLAQSWDARSIFCNPPYGEARRPWARRCLELGQAGGRLIALLIPGDADTAIAQAVIRGADAVTFLAGRVDFGVLRSATSGGRTWRATHPSMIATWGFDLVGSELGVTVRAIADPRLL